MVEATGHPVGFIPTDWNDVADVKKAIDDAPPASNLVLENTRFHPGEEKNDLELAKRMASLGDLYVNDAFSAAHRAHASTEALAHLLPAAASRAMEAELTALQQGLGDPKKPVIALVGGVQSLVEDRPARKPRRLGRGGCHRRRHGLYLPLCAWARGRQSRSARKDLSEYRQPRSWKRPKNPAAASSCRSMQSPRTNSPPTRAAPSPTAWTRMDPEGMILDVGPAIGRPHHQARHRRSSDAGLEMARLASRI